MMCSKCFLRVMSDPGAGMSYVPDPKKAVGGHVLAHASTTRIMLKKVSFFACCCSSSSSVVQREEITNEWPK